MPIQYIYTEKILAYKQKDIVALLGVDGPDALVTVALIRASGSKRVIHK